MLELNGELLRPMDESVQPPQVNASVDAINIKRRVELGSLNFDSAVSELLHSSNITSTFANRSQFYFLILLQISLGCSNLNYWES